MSRTTLRPHDIPEGALIEVRVDEHGAFSVRFYWAENTAHHRVRRRGDRRDPRRDTRCRGVR